MNDSADLSMRQRIEAILLVVDKPQSVMDLAAAVSAPVDQVTSALEALRADYNGDASAPVRGFELREAGGGWRLYVREDHDQLVADFLNTQAPLRLSQAALETLAVIAYKQPVARSQVAAVQAVNVDGVVRTLLSRGLVCDVGQDEHTGATLYGTTDTFLEYLGINSVDELPPISPLLDDDVSELSERSR